MTTPELQVEFLPMRILFCQCALRYVCKIGARAAFLLTVAISPISYALPSLIDQASWTIEACPEVVVAPLTHARIVTQARFRSANTGWMFERNELEPSSETHVLVLALNVTDLAEPTEPCNTGSMQIAVELSTDDIAKKEIDLSELPPHRFHHNMGMENAVGAFGGLISIEDLGGRFRISGEIVVPEIRSSFRKIRSSNLRLKALILESHSIDELLSLHKEQTEAKKMLGRQLREHYVAHDGDLSALAKAFPEILKSWDRVAISINEIEMSWPRSVPVEYPEYWARWQLFKRYIEPGDSLWNISPDVSDSMDTRFWVDGYMIMRGDEIVVAVGRPPLLFGFATHSAVLTWRSKKTTFGELRKESSRSLSKEGWNKLSGLLSAGDEIWYFNSPKEYWNALSGRAGFLVVRDNKIIWLHVTALS